MVFSYITFGENVGTGRFHELRPAAFAVIMVGFLRPTSVWLKLECSTLGKFEVVDAPVVQKEALRHS